MNVINNDVNRLARIRELDLTEFLETLGHPVIERRKNNTDYWYLSPLRNERTASFHVDRLNNEWFDFGLMMGGNPIDFCLHYYQCSISQLLERFANSTYKSLVKFDRNLHRARADLDSKLIMKEARPLYAYPLKNYLHERSIPIVIADVFCKEVSYELNGRLYYGIGFRNNAGGWEIRNKNFKQSSAPKDITCLGAGASSCHVFEGFMDFLSYRALHPYEDPHSVDYVVLNGAGLFDRALPFLLSHERVHLWLDRDVTGLAYRDYALGLSSHFVDESALYANFKDLNDWLQHKGEVPRVRQKIGLHAV